MPEPKLRIFLDTNVIFSGLYSSQGAPGVILKYFVEGRISIVVSQQILEEVIRTIKDKLPEALPALKKFLVNAPPEVGGDPSPESIQRWAKEIHPADAAILAAAIAAKPDYFITGDNDFLGNHIIMEKAGINIMTPAQFLKLLEPGNHANLN
ncbi:putative toxin-antitoxin system toxin component, PIN family [Dehalococcoides mccartyi]|uniref:Toxin-antitoxin system toxin component, PIN family n=1 Tax=Dehalococcoides mccartyi TaxID=61435 RepID=A0AB38Z830_9CHLR|nr:putative toxin-antitoxin system toxin component, PIN family [Dehalococcoides mccartyi]WRO06739.1 putative toxin-antitoxin system toxin component, PIN family [Dehalococcoides mccartyi]